jgi:ABC-2 type transport system ATP-binding protein
MEAIKILDLEKSFVSDFMVKRTKVLKGLSLTVKEGELYGFLGQNGAGKTTTIKCLLGLIKPNAGDTFIFDKKSNTVNGRKEIGFLPEHPYFYDYLTVEELLFFTAKLFSIKQTNARKRVTELIARVGMTGKGHLKLRKLSKGMIQRIGLAQALVNDPKVLILDEPFSGLDPIGRKEVRDIILSLKDAGKTVFFSSHILQDMEMIADRVGILLDGKIIKEGVISEMISNHIDYYETTFTNIDETLLKNNQYKFVKRGNKFVVKSITNEEVNELIEFLIMNKAKMSSVVQLGQTLEDIFLKEIGQ